MLVQIRAEVAAAIPADLLGWHVAWLKVRLVAQVLQGQPQQ